MSRPHSSRELSFVRHATKPSTFVPSQERRDRLIGWLACTIGLTLLALMVYVLSR